MNLEASFGMALSGHYVLQKKNKYGDVTFETEFDNIVLDVGWDNFKARIASSSNDDKNAQPKYLYLGSGSTEPQVTDTGLESVSATLPGKLRSSDTYSRQYFSGGVGWTSVTQTFNYGSGEAEGVWTELGLAYQSTYTEPYNRSLIRDQAGVPISITVLSDEYLTVYVTLKLYFVQPTGQSTTITYNGQQSTVTWEIQNDIFHGNTGEINAWRSGLPSLFEIKKSATYTSNWSAQRLAGYGLTYEGNLVWSATGDIIIEPGSAHTVKYAVFYTPHRYGAQNVVIATIDPPFSIPDTHKTTVSGPHTIQWSRVPVPTV